MNIQKPVLGSKWDWFGVPIYKSLRWLSECHWTNPSKVLWSWSYWISLRTNLRVMYICESCKKKFNANAEIGSTKTGGKDAMRALCSKCNDF